MKEHISIDYVDFDTIILSMMEFKKKYPTGYNFKIDFDTCNDYDDDGNMCGSTIEPYLFCMIEE